MALKIDNSNNTLTLTETGAPATPASGTLVLYASADGSLHIKNDAGLDKELAGGATTLSGLTDVALGSPLTTDEVLTYNGTNWVNQAVGGGAAIETTFTFSTATGGAPATSVLRGNTSSLNTATQLGIDDTSLQGLDIGTMFGSLSIGDQIYIKQADDDSKYVYLTVDGYPTDNTGYWTVPVVSADFGTQPDNGATIGIMRIAGKSMGTFGTNIMAGDNAGNPSQSTGGGDNISIGEYAGGRLGSGALTNILIGHDAGRAQTSGDRTIAIGDRALGNSSVSSNARDHIFIGRQAGFDAVASSYHSIAIGTFASRYETGQQNTFIGPYSGCQQVAGNSGSFANVGVGRRAGHKISSGDDNVFVGTYAGKEITTGSGNICIGKQAGPTTNVSDQLFINSDTTASNTPLIHGDFSTGEVTINTDLTVTNLTVTGTTTGIASAPQHEKIIVAGSPISDTITTSVTLVETAGSPIQTAYVQVFRNGMLMDEDIIGGSPLDITEDYAITGANTIVFADGILEANDKIKIYVFG